MFRCKNEWCTTSDPKSVICKQNLGALRSVEKQEFSASSNNPNKRLKYTANQCNFESFEYVCSACGFDYGHINPFLKEQVESLPTFSTEEIFGKRSTYKRKSHFVERSSNHLVKDPIIPEDDLTSILCETRSVHPEYFNSGASQRPLITKQQIQQILKSLDKKLTLHNEPERYRHLYLEKHKQIQKAIYGESSDFMIDCSDTPQLYKKMPLKYLTPHQIMETGSVFSVYSGIWDSWKLETPPKFPERKRFPNFNYTFVRIFELLQLEDGVDVDFAEFPIPRDITKNKEYVDALEQEAKKLKIFFYDK